MRVFFITVDDPVYAPLYLQKIIEPDEFEFVGVTALSPFGRRGLWATLRERYGLYGPRDFARAVQLFANNTLKDRLAIGLSERFYSIERLAKAYDIPTFSTTNVNDPDYLTTLRDLDLDVIVCVAADQLFKQPLIDTAGRACINVHSALLPKYRGVDALFWAVLNGETRTGVSVHYMNERFDDGDIIEQAAFDILPLDTLDALYLRAIDVGSKLIRRALSSIESGTVTRQSNPVEEGSNFSAPTAEAARRFRELGRRFF